MQINNYLKKRYKNNLKSKEINKFNFIVYGKCNYFVYKITENELNDSIYELSKQIEQITNDMTYYEYNKDMYNCNYTNN